MKFKKKKKKKKKTILIVSLKSFLFVPTGIFTFTV